MTQAISIGGRIGAVYCSSAGNSCNSSGFGAILDKVNNLMAMGAANVSTSEPTTKEEKSAALAKELKEAAEGVTVCKKCGSIFMGKTIAVCTKCANDLAAQRKEEADTTQQVSDSEKSAAPEAAATAPSQINS